MNSRKAFLYLLILVPPAYIVYLIFSHGRIVPYWDQWALVGLLEKLHTNTLAFSDIWQQHNEHRIVFPKIIFLILAQISGWNIYFELFTSFVIVVIIFLILYSLLRETLGKSFNLWYAVVLSLIIFSPIQEENWLWGWQLQIFLTVLGTVVTVWSLHRYPGRAIGFFGAVSGAILATFSFGHGIITWICGAVLMVLMKEWKYRHIAVWSLFFVVCLALILHGFKPNPGHPAITILFERPDDYFRYVLAFLGSPLAYGVKDVSITISSIFILLLATILIYTAKRFPDSLTDILPWVTLALYGILSAAVIGVGRVGFGESQALSSRYTTISMLFVISVLVIMAIAANRYYKTYNKLPTWLVVALSSFCTLLILGYTLSVQRGLQEAKRTTGLSRYYFCIENPDVAQDECLTLFFPDPGRLRNMIKSAIAMGYLKFVDWGALQKAQGGKMVIETLHGGRFRDGNFVVNVSKEKKLTMWGWAVDDERKNSGEGAYIVFYRNGDEIIVPTSKDKRSDIADKLNDNKYTYSGWSHIFLTEPFKEGCYDVGIRILRDNKNEYLEVPSETTICFEKNG